MSYPDLSKLTDAEIANYNSRLLSNCMLYGMTVSEAVSKGDGLIARVASTCALRDVKNRRLRPGSTR